MYQSIPSLTIPPPGKTPGNFFDGRIPNPRAKEEFKTPTLRPIKTSKNPTPRGIFLNYSLKKHEKIRQKSCKTAKFYHL